MPEAATRMRTSPGPGSGSGILPSTRTSRAGPCFSYQAAVITIRDRLRPPFYGEKCLQRAMKRCFPLVCREQERRQPHGPTEVYLPAYSLVEDVPRGTAAASGSPDRNGSPPPPTNGGHGSPRREQGALSPGDRQISSSRFRRPRG